MKQFKFNERQRFSIRKFSIGAASVLLGSVFFAVNSVTEVQAMEANSNTVLANNANPDLGSVPTAKSEEVSPSSMNPEEDKNNSESGILVSPILDSNPKKQALAKLIEEIDGKISSGAYDEKTEDSVNRLKAVLEEAKATVNAATTEGELTQAHSRLVTATTQLKTKSEDKEQAPAVDTTNGKATVGKKATNTEKASESNSIANSGSRDERNGKELDKNNPFRTEAATTNDDPAANQTYTAPAENADLNELKSELLKLPDAVQNNTKIQDMNDLGDQTRVARGEVKEIQEFGGWKAINQPDGTAGKFAIARKTEAGVFPVETVNTVFTNIRNGQARYYDTYVGEQAFDRSKDYMLFLGKVRTRASESEQTFNGKPYQSTGLGGSDSYAIKSFSGIEKTFKAHSPATGSKVKVAFKTGFTGDLNGTKAKYLVEVVYRQNDSEVTAYTYTFEPQPRATVKNDKGIVTPAKDGTGRAYIRSEFNNYTLNKAEVEAKMAEAAYKPNGQAGTFTSSDIDLPVGVTEYTVRIKVTDTDRMGMGYQSPLRHYALPVTGLDFSIEQDTRKLAKNLLQRVYDKLKATEERDIKGKTEGTISAYKEQLKNVENLLAGDLKNTQEYKDIVTAVLAGQQALRTDKSKLTASNNNLLGLINEDPDPRIGKTPISKEPYNTAKDEAIKAREKAQTILDQENPDPDVVAAAVSKLNEKLAELKAARAELVVAATEDQKTKLKNDSDALKEADKTGKTPKSIAEYEAKYETLKTALTAAKNQAKAVLDKTENAGKVEATYAQIEVDKIKAELDKAAALLKDKGNTAELEKAKNDLKTLTQETNVTTGKTKATSDKYEAAKTAAETAVTAAEAVIGDINSTTEDVANALAEVKAKKAALEAAKAALVDKVTEAQKTTLGNAGTDLAVLGDAELAGKTKATADAYKAETGNLTEEIAAAKREAEAILADPENKTQAEAALVQSKIEALKAKLEAAKAKLVAKADTAELSASKADLDTKAKEVVPTEGKTKATVDAYNEAKTAAAKAVTDAEAVINDENVTDKAVANALAEVKAKKAALEAAKAALVDKITQDQKDDLANAEENLKLADTTGKAKESVKAYNDEVAKLSDELAAAKQAAKDLLDKGDNAGELEAYRVQAKINKLKSKLAEAAKLLKDIDKSAAKKEIEDAAKNVNDAIDDNADLTPEQKDVAKAKVAEEATKAIGEIDKATTEDDVTAAKNAGKFAIEKEAAKAEVEAAKAAKEKAINANDKLSDDEKQAAKDAVEEAATNAIQAIDAAQDQSTVDSAKTTGKEAVDAVNPVGKEKALEAVEKIANEKTKAIDANDKLSDKEKKVAKDSVAEEASKAAKAINDAQNQEAVDNAKNAGTAAVEAVNPVGKEKALAAIDKALAEKEKAIDANDKLSDAEKEAAKEEAKKAADEAKRAINEAKDQVAVDAKQTEGTNAVEAVNPVGKEKALDAIQKATEDKLAEIDRDDKLSDKEKAKAKAEVAKAAIDAVNAINEATDQAAVNAKQTEGIKAVSEVNPVGKDKAKAEIEKELAEKTNAIDSNPDLTDAQKAEAKAKLVEEAKKAIAEIDKATTTEEVTSAKESGKLAIEKEAAKAEIEAAKAAKEKAIDANPDLTEDEKAEAKARVEEEAEAAKNAIDKATELSDIEKVTETGKDDIKKVTVTSAKEEAKKAIDKALEEKEKAIDARTDLTQEEKEAAKNAAREEAEAAKNAIDKATTLEDINKVLEDGKENIAKINPENLKDKAKKAIDEALAEKEKAIDARTDLTQEEKEAAKNAAREEAEAAKNAIDKATISEDINKVLEDGKENIAKINPENLKDKAKKAIDEALAAKEKAIDARTDLLPEEKEAAKKAAREEAEAAKNAIDKATTSEDINKVLEDGKENIANINPVGAKEEAKKAVEEALANKEKELDGRTDLTSEEKVKAKELAREEAKAAKDAIDKAISIDGIEKALRPFLYQIDQDALVFDRPELDIKAALQASITGTVIAERGNAITQADIIAKLNLPETVTVMNIELPDTTTLGRKFAKVTLKLADGTQATVSVPVEVVEKSEENHQQNNTQVKPQEVSKPAAEPSKNSEQVEDGKDTPSKASEEKNSSKQTVLPNTGTADSTVAMVAAAASALLGLGLAGRRRKEDEEA